MKALKLLLAVAVGTAMSVSAVTADDGERLVRNVSSSPGITENPEPEGEHAFIKLMNFRVPAQLASGELTEIVYNTIDGTPPTTGVYAQPVLTAKPLINVYVYGPVIGFDNHEDSGYAGHGRRDGFGAVSLDDGETWRVTNLSNSADESSFVVEIPLQDPGVAVGEGEVEVDDPDSDVLVSATWNATRDGGSLNVTGDSGNDREKVEIRNAVTGKKIFTVASHTDGKFDHSRRMVKEPCMVQAGIGGKFGPPEEVEGATEECVGGGATLITDYPGDVRNIFHAVAGNKVMAAWHSKFCRGGNPAFGAEYPTDDVATYLGIDNLTDLYLTDIFGVGGSQGSTDYNEVLEFDQVGEVPHSCLWSARGVLREDPEAEGTTQMVWFQAERLTSGRRDVNRVETACVAGAGCAITWQEDPEGVRPGEGEGPGTGWSGATTASKTDIWYSFVEWEDFDIIADETSGDPVPLGDLSLATGRPQPYVPMMAAARLTNNDRCSFGATVDLEKPDYCIDADASPYGIKNQCVGAGVSVPLGPQDNLKEICVVDSNDDGTMNAGDMPNLANAAASRPRLNLQPRDSDGDGIVDDAWVVVVSEEDKGLGRWGFLNDEEWDLGNLDDTGAPCVLPEDESEETNCVKADLGKDVFWTSFNLGSPATSAGVDVDYSLVENVLSQGAQLNQPEVNWRTGTYYPPMDTLDMWDFGGGVASGEDSMNYLIFNTEIARRTSMMSQSLGKALASEGNLVAMPLWKQGINNQGGSADISTRRIVAAEGIDEKIENPYAASNIVCAFYDGEGVETLGVKYFTDGTNPYYPHGLCMAAPINLSARTPYECKATANTTADGLCPGVSDMTCVDDTTFGQLCSSLNDPEDDQFLDVMLTWYECPGWNGTNVSGDAVMEALACGKEPDSALIGSNMDDASWYNPMEVSKAHRGFLDGDYISMIYAWSPNWKLNTAGHDRYELYTRRSFDGGVTWTTTPTSFTASDGLAYSGSGTTTCETMRDGEDSTTDTHMCTLYGAGDFEQSRNVSQLTSMANTILDPRYTPTIAGMAEVVDLDWGLFTPIDPTDLRNPSRNFVVYEDGDNTTVTEGEAEPLNLAYGRAEVWGDHFTVWTEIDTGFSTIADCYPNNTYGDDKVLWAEGTGFCHEFDTLEGFRTALSEEASITASAHGDFLYGVWGQFNVDLDNDNEFIDGDSMFRRIWYLDDYISDEAYKLPGTEQ